MKQPIISFNTKCNYTEHGQRIAATILANGDAYFVDIDRCIDGHIPQHRASIDHLTQRVVMDAYRSGNYEPGYPMALWRHSEQQMEERYAIRAALETAAENAK